MQQLLTRMVEAEDVKILGIVRHFMSLNVKLLDIGLFDSMIELQAPTKEQRYKLIKDLIAPVDF